MVRKLTGIASKIPGLSDIGALVGDGLDAIEYFRKGVNVIKSVFKSNNSDKDDSNSNDNSETIKPATITKAIGPMKLYLIED